MSDQLEMYYAEMEAARNAAEEAYFEARPQLSHDVMQQVLFRRGFEMGFKYLWDKQSGLTQKGDSE